MGTGMDIIQSVREIVARQLNRDASEIGDETNLEESGYDSLDVLETIFAIEEKFQIRVPFDANDPAVKSMKTVGDIIGLVEQALLKRAPA